MPIYQLLKDQSFGPEDITLLATTFEAALRQLGLADRNAPAAQTLARRIMELAHQGERDPDRLRERALEGL